MKKVLVATLALGVTVGIASTASAVLNGSAHDFGTSPGGAYQSTGLDGTTGTAEMCNPCHTPHNAYGPGPAYANNLVPLWNHVTTAAVHVPYDGDYAGATGNTFDAVPGAPAGVSLACLSCHDGTEGPMEYYLSGGGTGPTAPLVGTANIGIDLSNDHPVSFTYDAALVAADTATSGTPGLNDPTVAPVAPLLFGGEMECGSCHDVHNQGAGTTYLLQIDNTDSALCLTCHIK